MNKIDRIEKDLQEAFPELKWKVEVWDGYKKGSKEAYFVADMNKMWRIWVGYEGWIDLSIELKVNSRSLPHKPFQAYDKNSVKGCIKKLKAWLKEMDKISKQIA